MENNQNLLPMQNEKKTKTETDHPYNTDPCPVCKEELYLNEEYTQRIGLIDDFDEVIGWLCPHCKTEYDTDTKIVRFLGSTEIGGQA